VEDDEKGAADPDRDEERGDGAEPPLAARPGLRVALAAMAALLVGQRLLHLTGPIDDPHSWRQCDSACFILGFVAHGIDLLAPRTCWMGGHGVVALHFPLLEAIVAALHPTSPPDPIYARLVHFAFFLGCAACLHRILRRVGNDLVAAVATVLFLSFPLAVFYSRAVHVEFAALFFGLLMTQLLLAGYDARRAGLLAAGVAAGTLGFLVKAPTVFYLFLPLAYRIWSRRDRWAAAWSAALWPVPVAAFSLWRVHVERVNAQAPDWSFIPGYFKFVDMGWWYYGRLAARLDPAAWRTLAERALLDVAGPLGVATAIAGLVLGRRHRAWPFVAWWSAGTLLYVLVFFNVNLIHDYYQVPLLAPAAALGAIFVDASSARLARRSPRVAGAATIAACIAVAASGVGLAEMRDYSIDELRVAAGTAIAGETPPGALVVASIPGTDPRDPRLLCRAEREGWSIDARDLRPDLVARLHAQGARYVALVHDPSVRTAADWLVAAYASRTRPLAAPWSLTIADLDAPAPPAP
jgi:4-amino-4-deoxy-L-arabinose transferase-like glycosyltransferase